MYYNYNELNMFVFLKTQSNLSMSIVNVDFTNTIK